MTRRFAYQLLLLAPLTASLACAPMIGAPSFSLMARDRAVDQRYVAVGERIEDSDCFYWALILAMWGKPRPSHEAVVGRMLEEHQADVLLDADLTTSQYGTPYLFLMQCANVEGTPARLAAQGGSR